MDKKIFEQIIKNQDRLIYFFANSMAENTTKDNVLGISNTDLTEIIIQNEEILNSLSTRNLATLLSSLSTYSENKTKVEERLMAKKQEGENIFSGLNAEYDYMGFNTALTFDAMFSRLSEENQKDVIASIQSRFDGFKDENEEMFNLADKLHFYLNIANFISCYDRGIFSPQSVEFMHKVADKDLNIFNGMNFNMMQDKFLEINEDSLIHILRYPNLSSRLQILKDNSPEILDVFIEETNNLHENEHISTEYEAITRMSKFMTKNYPFLEGRSRAEIADLSLKDFELCEKYLENEKENQSLDEFLDEEFKKTIEHEKMLGQKYSPFTQSSLRKEKCEIILNKYFSLSYDAAQKIIEQYGQDLASVESDLTDKSKEIFIKIKAILDLENLEELNNIYNGKHQEISLEAIPAKDMIAIESSYREAFAKTYTKSFGSTEDKISAEMSNAEVVNFEGKEVKVVKLSPPFNFLIHSSDTGFKGDKKLKDDSFKKTWTDNADTSHHLVATANIDENFMGMAPVGKNGVYYGFIPRDEENINLMGNHDINSHVRSSEYAAENPRYISQENMSFNTRRVYSEFAIEKTNPDFVVIFDDMDEDKVKNAYKSAAEFGIPVISIDKKEIVKYQEENIENMLANFGETNSVQDLGKIIKTYETNRAGWLLNRADEKDETFTESIRHTEFAEKFDNLGKKIRTVLVEFQKSASKEELMALKGILENEAELYRSQNELNLPFAEVKMSDFLTVTLEEVTGLVEKNGITFEEVSRETEKLEELEKSNEAKPQEMEVK